MREIKFRAWNKEKEIMRDWEVIKTEAFPLFLAGGSIHEIMQFTGLLDKNGKEIYEGDFLIDNDSEPMRHRIVWISDQAKFEIETLADEEGNWECLIVDSLGELVNGKNNVVDGFEIIGNIYENPELTPQSDE